MNSPSRSTIYMAETKLKTNLGSKSNIVKKRSVLNQFSRHSQGKFHEKVIARGAKNVKIISCPNLIRIGHSNIKLILIVLQNDQI